MRLPSADLETILANTDGLWKEMQKARLLLTGCTGFLGHWLLEPLLHAIDRYGLETSVTLLTRNPDAFRDKAPHLARHRAVVIHKGDVTSIDPEVPALAGITHVIHAAAPSQPGLLTQTAETVVQGTWRVIRLAQRERVTRFLYISSGAVYGPQPPALTHIGENYRGAPDLTPTSPSVEGESKRMAELLCRIAHAETGLPVTIARCFEVIGPFLPAHSPVGHFIREALDGKPIQVQGDGTPVHSYLYAADLAIWLWNILLRGEAGRVYNVGSPEEISLGELAGMIGSLLNTSVTTTARPAPGVPPSRHVPDPRRAECELGLIRTTPLREAVCKTVEWYRSTMLSHA